MTESGALLLKHRNELANLRSHEVISWEEVEAWHAGTRPVIEARFQIHLTAFDQFNRVRRSTSTVSGVSEKEAPRAVDSLITFLDGLIEVEALGESQQRNAY